MRTSSPRVTWAGPSHLEDQGRLYTSYGFMAKAKINREDFGITYNIEMEHGGVGISRQVYLNPHPLELMLRNHV